MAGNCPVIGCSFFRPHIFKLLYSFLSNSIIRTLPGYIRIFSRSPFSQRLCISKQSILIFLGSCAISGYAPRVNIWEQYVAEKFCKGRNVSSHLCGLCSQTHRKNRWLATGMSPRPKTQCPNNSRWISTRNRISIVNRL